jgi:ATP-binding cassette, subfamily B, bacterial
MTQAPIPTTTAIRRVLQIAPALRRGLPVTVVLTVIGTSLQLVVPVVIQRVVDQDLFAPGGVDLAGVLEKGAVALAAMVVAAFSQRMALYRLGRAAATGLADLRVRTFAHLHRLSSLHVQSEQRGALVARVTSDIARIQDFMDWGGIGMLVGSAQVLLAITAMLLYEWRLALMVVGAVAFYALLLVWFQRILARAHDRVRQTVADSLSAMGESISGLEAVRAYGAEGPTMNKVRGALDTQFSAEFRTSKLGSFLFSSAELFAGLITAGVIAGGVLLGQDGGITAGTLLALLFLVNLLVQPVQTLVETLDIAQAAAAGVRRVLQVLDTPVDLADPVDGVDLPDDRLDVGFVGVGFRYPGGEQALRNVDLHVPAGCRVAVVGETGSGKTTFAKLVARLLDPTDGRVEVGNIDVRRVRFASLRNRVAYVPQEGFLFDTTVAENVRYGRPGVPDDALRLAFADLGLTDWLDSLPNGLATPVGERGSQLSAGERQLVALVRAWMVDPDLLVLDEATSAVDPALDVQLRRAMGRLIAGRTSITVAHRLSTAEASDLVLVFDRGELVERGSHADLVERDGVYAHLHADWAAGTRMG